MLKLIIIIKIGAGGSGQGNEEFKNLNFFFKKKGQLTGKIFGQELPKGFVLTVLRFFHDHSVPLTWL